MSRIAVITGVASGMGKCIAQKLVENNYTVYGVDINPVELDGVNSSICDVSNENQVKSFFKTVSETLNHIDCLINVAGILCYKERNTIENLSSEEWKRVLEVNLDSVFYMTKYSLPLLKKSQNASIINFSSDQVYKAKKKSAPYAVSKAAIEMLTKITAAENLDTHIRVNAVAFASVATNFINNYVGEARAIEMIKSADESMPYGIIRPEDAWDVVRFLLADGCKITGQIIMTDSGTLLQK